MKKPLLTAAILLGAGPVLFVGSAAVVGIAQGILAPQQAAPVVTPVVHATPVAQPVDISTMTMEEYAKYALIEECKRKGIALGAPCDRHHEQEDAKVAAERKANLERQTADAYDRVTDPARHCSAVANTCW